MADRVDRATGGYEAEFVEPLPEEYECPICQLAFRDPIQIEECGHRFCQSCLQELRRLQGSPVLCPMDRRPISSTKVFVDKAARRAILGLGVKCWNWKRKCEWTGELSNIEEHAKNCAHEDVHCTNPECNEVMPRRSLQYHLVSKCKWRIVSCHFCTEMYTYKDGKTHMKSCKRLPIECVNKCGAKDIPREEMPFHMSECPLAVHPCMYRDIGCPFKGRRDALEEHCKNAVHTHLNIACQKIRENESRSLCTNGIFLWKISNYKHQYDQAVASPEELAIFSPPFYTSQYGYKLRLKAYLNGRDRGKGTHLSLYIIIMKGDYDALLEWPFKQKITFYLIDQSEKQNHRTHLLSPNRSLPNIKVVFNRPTVKENLGIGNPCFVPNEVLESGEYVKDDVMFIKAVVEPGSSKSQT
ncbi:predicted protein [Nematostella vectensis]|uniref:TNF receptor-associated factor n=2 Tax=Nematostella vectensis TaxID=45351 RepID=A7RGK7_NEMVE|nr:predicted protein [Nematostella vectensis]|eukprot:XP_001641608.1 predicted protein [Nematostella vectensis]